MAFEAWTLCLPGNGYLCTNMPVDSARYIRPVIFLFDTQKTARTFARIHGASLPSSYIHRMNEHQICLVRRPRKQKPALQVIPMNEDSYTSQLYLKLVAAQVLVYVVETYVVRRGVVTLHGTFHDPSESLKLYQRRDYVVCSLNGLLSC